ncbi:MAG: hypothetical protein HW375_25 [Anaerolineales bacterium]|nr:hypothetical protein [Anaerolineales bacterium]
MARRSPSVSLSLAYACLECGVDVEDEGLCVRCWDSRWLRLGPRLSCSNGHPYDAPNVYTDPDGKRRCRSCATEARRRYVQTAVAVG